MRLILCLALLLLSFSPLAAQALTPARPADPNQSLPAQPVTPPSIVPTAPPAGDSAAPATTSPVALSIIADSSLKAVLQELAQGWADSQDTNPQVPITLTNAKTLRTKVEAAPSDWDLVISADVEDVKEMTDNNLLVADGQRSLARNTLIIYGRKALLKDDQLDWFDLIGTEWKKVALGDSDLVESGRVAERALKKHALLDSDHKSLYIYKPTDALVLGVAEREEADAVFCYRSDLAGVTIPGFDIFQPDTEDAPPVFYTAAISRLAKNPAQAQAFIDFCATDAAKAVWIKHGFETN